MAGAVPPRLRVLVVDDCVKAAWRLASLLASGGHEARVAHDGPAALAVATAYRPDVVFLELSICPVEGCEVARLLRTRAGASRLLLVALSAGGDARHRRLAREAGFDALLFTPASHEVLRQTLAAAGETPGARIPDELVP
jgi:CheY-like chemotaxis protein